MTTRSIRHLALALYIAGMHSLQADPPNFIASLGCNGNLSWTSLPGATGYRVYWAPSPDGPWTAGWDSSTFIPATGPVMQVSVPMFYRVAAIADTNTLLIHGDGENGSGGLVDEAGHGITRIGDTSISTAQSKFGGASVYFDGVGDSLSLPASADWSFGTDDFTVDFWVSFSATPGTVHLIGSHTAGSYSEWALVYSGGAVRFLMKNSVVLTYPWSPPLNTWHHVAVTRKADIASLIINGKLVSAAANNSDLQTANRPLTIAATDNNNYFFNGYLDEIRINKGTAYWSASFALPTSPYAHPTQPAPLTPIPEPFRSLISGEGREK